MVQTNTFSVEPTVGSTTDSDAFLDSKTPTLYIFLDPGPKKI